MQAADVLAQHIVATPGVLGGKPRVSGRRITVAQIAPWHGHQGLSADEIATAHDLTLGDGYAALAYCHDHREAIDATTQADDALVASLRAAIPSKVKARDGA